MWRNDRFNFSSSPPETIVPEFEHTTDAGTIVVTAGYRYDGGTWLMDLDRSRAVGPVMETYRPATADRTSSSATFAQNNDLAVYASVNVIVPNTSTHFAEAVKAGENVAKTLAQLESILNDLLGNRLIQWGSRTMTVSQVLAELHNTEFKISDQNNYRNGGVGTAVAGEGNARNVDTLYFEAFDGDRDSYVYGLSTSGKPLSTNNDYADVAYTRNQGMMAVMLHELGHLTEAGFDFNYSSKDHFRRENGGRMDNAKYNGSEYWSNNESFSNSFADSVSMSMGGNWGIDVPSVTSIMGGADWREPSSIYADHMML